MDKAKIIAALQDISFGSYLRSDTPLSVLSQMFEKRLDAFNELEKLPDCSKCPGLTWIIAHQTPQDLEVGVTISSSDHDGDW